MNNTHSTCLDYNSIANTNTQSSENLLATGNSIASFNQMSNKNLFTDGNFNADVKNEEFTLNRKNNDFIEILDNINIKESNNLEASFNFLEKKLDEKLIAIKQENEKNKILNLNKKYNAYRNAFEETIKAVSEFNNNKSNSLLNKILNGYNDTVQTLFFNFTKLHEKFTEGESVYQSK